MKPHYTCKSKYKIKELSWHLCCSACPQHLPCPHFLSLSKQLCLLHGTVSGKSRTSHGQPGRVEGRGGRASPMGYLGLLSWSIYLTCQSLISHCRNCGLFLVLLGMSLKWASRKRNERVAFHVCVLTGFSPSSKFTQASSLCFSAFMWPHWDPRFFPHSSVQQTLSQALIPMQGPGRGKMKTQELSVLMRST